MKLFIFYQGKSRSSFLLLQGSSNKSAHPSFGIDLAVGYYWQLKTFDICSRVKPEFWERELYRKCIIQQAVNAMFQTMLTENFGHFLKYLFSTASNIFMRKFPEFSDATK